MNDKIKEIIEIINNHNQFEDDNSHNSVRIINNCLVVLGSIVGTITYCVDFTWNGVTEKNYLTQIIKEDDDFWFEGSSKEFNVYWLSDYEKVFKITKDKFEEFKEEIK